MKRKVLRKLNMRLITYKITLKNLILNCNQLKSLKKRKEKNLNSYKSIRKILKKNNKYLWDNWSRKDWKIKIWS